MSQASHHIATALLPGGWARDVRLSVRDGLVDRLETGVAPEATDARHTLVIPGLPNLHSHAFQRGMAGLAEKRGAITDSFWTWREVMYRFVDRLDPDDVAAIAALAYMEMLESGFTRVGEFNYLHHDRNGDPYADPAEMSASLASGAAASGIALTLLPVFYAQGGFGGAAPGPAQRRFVCDIDLFGRIVAGGAAALGALPDATQGIAPHSLRAVTPEQITRLVEAWPGGVVHVHVAEQVREVEDCLAWSGARPVEWLLDHAEVDGRWCLVHATHMNDRETADVAARGAVAGLCPITEANLGDGLFSAGAFVQAGGRYGVGTDSNVLIDAAQELCTFEYGQRLHHRARNMLSGAGELHTGAAMYRAALAGGAAALGCASGLAVGAAADFVELDIEHPSLVVRSPEACLDSWIFAAGRSAVKNVWRRGECWVADGRHRARDAILADYRRVIRRLAA